MIALRLVHNVGRGEVVVSQLPAMEPERAQIAAIQAGWMQMMVDNSSLIIKRDVVGVPQNMIRLGRAIKQGLKELS
jgi:hypothetical protein